MILFYRVLLKSIKDYKNQNAQNYPIYERYMKSDVAFSQFDMAMVQGISQIHDLRVQLPRVQGRGKKLLLSSARKVPFGEIGLTGSALAA